MVKSDLLGVVIFFIPSVPSIRLGLLGIKDLVEKSEMWRQESLLGNGWRSSMFDEKKITAGFEVVATGVGLGQTPRR
jgi:hypothetical protein